MGDANAVDLSFFKYQDPKGFFLVGFMYLKTFIKHTLGGPGIVFSQKHLTFSESARSGCWGIFDNFCLSKVNKKPPMTGKSSPVLLGVVFLKANAMEGRGSRYNPYRDPTTF